MAAAAFLSGKNICGSNSRLISLGSSFMLWRRCFVPEPEIKKKKKQKMVASPIGSESPGSVGRLAFSVMRHCLRDHAGSDYKDWLSEWKSALTVPGSTECMLYTLMRLMCVFMCIVAEKHIEVMVTDLYRCRVWLRVSSMGHHTRTTHTHTYVRVRIQSYEDQPSSW